MDLFDAFDKLFRKEPIEDPPSDYMLHRFLASQEAYAPFCKEMNMHVRDNAMTWEIWRTALPKSPRAPYLPYPAPKKSRLDDFTEQLSDRLGLSLTKTESIVEIIDLAGNREEVASYYGIEL